MQRLKAHDRCQSRLAWPYRLASLVNSRGILGVPNLDFESVLERKRVRDVGSSYGRKAGPYSLIVHLDRYERTAVPER